MNQGKETASTVPNSDLAPVAVVIILAADGGMRMKSCRSKLLHGLCGRSMLSYAVSAVAALNPHYLVVAVGHQYIGVLEHLESLNQNVTIAIQEQQLGTGHAVAHELEQLPDLEGEVVVTYGDVPLLMDRTLCRLAFVHWAESNAVTVPTAEVGDPVGYGRTIHTDERATGIVEHRSASDEQLLIREINSGIYVFDTAVLCDGPTQLSTDNAQGEQYLTDTLRYAHDLDRPAGALITEDAWQIEGVSGRVQLTRMSQELNRRILECWMREGVTTIDLRNTWVDIDVDLSQDAALIPGVIPQGMTTTTPRAVIGPDITLQDAGVGENVTVIRSHGFLAIIGDGINANLFSYLRPGTQPGPGGKIGAFVKAKNTIIEERSKALHLSYVGNTVIGDGANIGAGTISVSYDGVNKSTTYVENLAFIGSNPILMAPVDISDEVFVTTGSAITDDVPVSGLVATRGRQRNIDDWLVRRRSGLKAARAAAESDGNVHPAIVESRVKEKE